MNYRYLAFIGSQDEASALERDLANSGMPLCFATGSMNLFIARDTPWLPLPCGGAAIGRMFSRDGIRIRRPDQLGTHANPTETRKYVVEHCWGEYLLIQPGSDGSNGVTVTRDPAPCGEFPCIYSLQGGLGFITSDISIPIDLNIYRKQIDWETVAHCLAYPQIKTSRTGMAGVRELLSGTTLHIRGDDVQAKQEWSPWDFVGSERRHTDPREAAAQVQHAVSLAVRTSANAGNSILLELSGGLDSSIVGACLRGTSARVVCCTLLAPVPGADERHYAAQIAQLLGTPLHVADLRLEEASFSFPLTAPVPTPKVGALQYAIDRTMQAVANRHGIESFFTGAGGDTVFSYLKTAAPAADALREGGLKAGLAAIRDLSELHQCSLWTAGKLAIRKLRRHRSFETPDRSFLAAGAISGPLEGHPWLDPPGSAFPGDVERIFGLAASHMFRDSAPRGTTRHLRMPLLSQPVVEACLRVPSWMWIADGRNRAIARAAFTGVLPPDILNRRSKGTFMSYVGAVYERDKRGMLDYLLTGRLRAHGLIEPASLRLYVEGNGPTRDRSFTRIFDLCMVENWVRHHL